MCKGTLNMNWETPTITEIIPTLAKEQSVWNHAVVHEFLSFNINNVPTRIMWVK